MHSSHRYIRKKESVMKDTAKEETIFGEDWPYSKAKSSLLRSAAIVMREQGPRSATLKNIAGKAGVTEPAIFRHFDGVDGLFQSLFVVMDLFYAKFNEYFKSQEFSGIFRLEAANEKILATLKGNPEFAYVLAKPDPIFRQYAKLHVKQVEIDAKLRSATLECVKEAKSNSQLVQGAEVEAVTTAIIGTLYQSMYNWIENIDSYDLLKEGKKALNVVYGLVKKPGIENVPPKGKAKKKS
jgi:AcrR family transcriptional regulator